MECINLDMTFTDRRHLGLIVEIGCQNESWRHQSISISNYDTEKFVKPDTPSQ